MEKSREVDFVSRHHRCVVCEASRLEYIYIYISLTAMSVAVIEKQGLGIRKGERVK